MLFKSLNFKHDAVLERNLNLKTYYIIILYFFPKFVYTYYSIKIVIIAFIKLKKKKLFVYI